MTSNMLAAGKHLTCMVDPRTHPVQCWSDEAKAAACGIMVHGDEGQGKKGRSVLVISWSTIGIGGKTYQCRFPFAVARCIKIKSLFPMVGIEYASIWFMAM